MMQKQKQKQRKNDPPCDDVTRLKSWRLSPLFLSTALNWCDSVHFSSVSTTQEKISLTFYAVVFYFKCSHCFSFALHFSGSRLFGQIKVVDMFQSKLKINSLMNLFPCTWLLCEPHDIVESFRFDSKHHYITHDK